MTAGGTRELRLPRPPGAGNGLAWVLGLGAAALVLVTVVTASTPVDVVSQSPSGSASSLSIEPPTRTPQTLTATATGQGFDPSQLPSLPPVLLTLVQLVVGALVLWAIIGLLRLAWRRIPRVRTRVVEGHPVPPLPDVPDELLESAQARRVLLLGGPPRNAIVACWVDLEDAASAAGLPRHPHETAAEYTVRVLKTWDIAPEAMGGLAELYREARHSRHPITEAHRADALNRLDVIHEDLQRVVDEARARAGLEEADQR